MEGVRDNGAVTNAIDFHSNKPKKERRRVSELMENETIFFLFCFDRILVVQHLK